MKKIISRRLYNLLTKTHVFSLKEKTFSMEINKYFSENSSGSYSVSVPDNCSESANFFDLRLGEISFHPKSPLQVIEDGKWKRDGRQTIKTGKFFQTYFPVNTFDIVMKTEDYSDSIDQDLKENADQYKQQICDACAKAPTEELRKSCLGETQCAE